MNAWIIAVGSELLTPFRIDTNSLAITERLNAVGCHVRFKAVVGDDAVALASLLERGIGVADLIVCTGGLGPTEDDVTRDALARVLGVPFEIDEAIIEHIKGRFARRGLRMPEINKRQAMVPQGTIVLENRNGTAPGLWAQARGTGIALLPGPTREMTPMLERLIEDHLAPLASGTRLVRRVIKITGRSESEVDTLAQPVYSRWVTAPVPIDTTILAAMGQIELHLTATATRDQDAEAALESAVEELQRALGDAVYSTDGQALEAVLGGLLRRRGLTLAVAESCSGGLLSSRITDVPGSSDYFERGVVCYSNRAKIDWLGVPESLIAVHGAVSNPVAEAMAVGIRQRASTDIGIGVTGIAGPGGGTADKPVGTVAIAVVMGDEREVRTYGFAGSRELVKFQSTQAAMNLLRQMLDASGSGSLS